MELVGFVSDQPQSTPQGVIVTVAPPMPAPESKSAFPLLAGAISLTILLSR